MATVLVLVAEPVVASLMGVPAGSADRQYFTHRGRRQPAAPLEGRMRHCGKMGAAGQTHLQPLTCALLVQNERRAKLGKTLSLDIRVTDTVLEAVDRASGAGRK